jgi:Tol biopolymer transport system component
MPSLTAGPTNTPTILATPLGGGTGQIVYASDRSGMPEVWIINIDGSGHTQLTHIAEGACQPDWSPDGTRIVFISPCPKNQDSYPGASLFIIDADGSNLTPLPSAPGGDYDPDWSPDGNKIVFTSLRDGGVARLYSINLKDNTVISLSGEESSNQQPDWSPDGEMIAYVGSDNRIWAMADNGQEKYGLTVGGGDFRSFNPGWSPDGKTLVFSRRRADDTSGLSWLMAVPYTNEGALPVEIPSALLSSEASYSSDGFWLVFKNWTSGNHDIYIMRANGIDRQPLVTDESYDFDPCWRPPVIQP